MATSAAKSTNAAGLFINGLTTNNNMNTINVGQSKENSLLLPMAPGAQGNTSTNAKSHWNSTISHT